MTIPTVPVDDAARGPDYHGPDEYGTGAIASPPDPRDFPIEALFAAAGLAASTALPPSFRVSDTPPVPNQGSTPQCVAYSSALEKGHQDRLDQGAFFNFDEARFFSEIGGTAQGAFMRAALDRMLHYGYPIAGGPDEASHKIAAYYAVPLTVDAIKQAIFAFGGALVIGAWKHSWFHPVSGVLPAPDYDAGGHATYWDGWNATGFEIEQSWGTAYGNAGRVTLPYRYLAAADGGYAWEAWKTSDVIEWIARLVKCGGGFYRTGPGVGYRAAGAIHGGEIAMAKAGPATSGGSWSLSCGTAKSGSSWYPIRAINGQSVQAKFGVPLVYAATGWF